LAILGSLTNTEKGVYPLLEVNPDQEIQKGVVMSTLLRAALIGSAMFAAGCAHQINITPPLNTLDGNSAAKVNKAVGYYIAPADLAKEVITPGGGGDKVKYRPYQESEPALQKVLSNRYASVTPVASLDDKQFFASKNIAYIFVPTIETDSSSSSALTWPPTNFTVTLDTKAIAPNGSVVWQKKVTGQGQAEFKEFKHDFSLSARRANKQAFQNLQQAIDSAAALR
jgi:hypothetical protein